MLGLTLVILAACPRGEFCSTTGTATAGHLFSAAARGPNDVWAVGEAGAALHWDGRGWTTTRTGVGDTLRSIVPLAPNDVWVTGNEVLLHWDGAWHAVDRSLQKGWAGPVLEVRPGELWVLGWPTMAISKGALVPLPEAMQAPAATLTGEQGIIVAASVCGPGDVWVLRRGGQLAHLTGTSVKVVKSYGIANVGGITCMGGAAWVTSDGMLVRCTSEGCTSVTGPQDPVLLASRVGPWVWGADKLWRWDGKKLVAAADAPGRWFGGVARADDDVVLVGAAGGIARFDGKRFSAPVTIGRVSSVTAAGAAAYLASDVGVFQWKDGKWVRDASFPEKRADVVWAASATEVWAIAEDALFRFDGKSWARVTIPGRRAPIRNVWGRGPKDVWAVSALEVWRWNGAAWQQLAAEREGWAYGRVTGDAKATWVLARGPRPENVDGPSTGMPDEMLVLDGSGVPKWLVAPNRPEDIAVINGELWVTAATGAYRSSGGQWLRMGTAQGRALVPTEKGVLIVPPAFYAWEWDGATLTELRLPSGNLYYGASSGGAVWLAGDDAVVRRGP